MYISLNWIDLFLYKKMYLHMNFLIETQPETKSTVWFLRIIHSIDSEQPKYFWLVCTVFETVCFSAFVIYRRIFFFTRCLEQRVRHAAVLYTTTLTMIHTYNVYIYILFPKITFPIHMHCSSVSKKRHQRITTRSTAHIYTHTCIWVDTQIHLLGRLYVNKISHLRFPQIFRGQNTHKKMFNNVERLKNFN